MKQENVFHIAFFTKDHPKEAGPIPPGWLSAVKVTIAKPLKDAVNG